MRHLEHIKIVSNNYRTLDLFPLNFEFSCDNVNLLVGDQGCGKSTLLKMIQEAHSDLEITLSQNVIKDGVNSFYFDTEKDNPRIKGLNEYSTPNGNNKGIGVGAALSSRFQSHGEVLEKFIVSPLMRAKDSVVLLDEPESGLSITNQYKLIKAIDTAVSNGCQLFIATHCYPLIRNYHTVISLEHLQKMSSKDFIESVESKFK